MKRPQTPSSSERLEHQQMPVVTSRLRVDRKQAPDAMRGKFLGCGETHDPTLAFSVPVGDAKYNLGSVSYWRTQSTQPSPRGRISTRPLISAAETRLLIRERRFGSIDAYRDGHRSIEVDARLCCATP